MAWTAPRTWIVGEVATAAEMNTYLRDNQNAFGSILISSQRWAGVGSVTFSAIPQTWSHLKLVGKARGSAPATGTAAIFVQVNGDGGANYHNAYNYTESGVNNPTTDGPGEVGWVVGRAIGAGTDAHYNTIDVTIPGYTRAERHCFHSMSGGFAGTLKPTSFWGGGRYYGSTSAITSLTVVLGGSMNIDASLDLYGLP